MEITKIKEKGVDIAVVKSTELIITDIQSALDFIATVNYETNCCHVILNKSVISEAFFDLKTRFAGEILQKFINYHMKIAVVGDFSIYSSKSLKDFMYESNKGKNMFFVSNEKEAAEKLAAVSQ